MTTTTVELPPPRPNAPILTRMMSDPLLGGDEPIAWVIGAPHPFSQGWQIRRMFLDSSGVEVYATSPDGKHGTRNLIPMTRVRLIEEGMSLDVFLDELEAAESDDDNDSDPGPELELDDSAPAATSNGQAVT